MIRLKYEEHELYKEETPKHTVETSGYNIPPQDELRYIICAGKKPIQPRKGIEKPGATLSELDDVDDLALCLPDGITVLDFDTEEMALKFMTLQKQYDLKCRTVLTDKGLHAYFRTPEPLSNRSGIELACGLVVDVKSYTPNVAITRQGGKDRLVLDDVDLRDVDELPKWLYPRRFNRGKTMFHELKEGGRNDTLYSYILDLQRDRFSIQDIETAIIIINDHILPEPLPQSELETILRSEAFKTQEELGLTDTNGEPNLYDPSAPWFKWKMEKDGSMKLEQFLHEILAQEIVKKMNIFLYNSSLYYYKDGYYRRIDERLGLEHTIQQYFPSIKINQVREVMGAIERMTYREMIPRQDEDIICCRNGRLDLNNGKLYPHSIDAYDTQQIATRYDPTMTSPVLDRVLNRMFPTTNVMELFEEFLGATLFKSLKYRGALYITGSGANGKSTVLSMISGMLGYHNVSYVSPKQMVDGSFTLPELENKLCNIADDIDEKDFGDSAIIKKLVTGEPIMVARKYQDTFGLRSYATMIFTANSLPHTGDKTYGAESRRIILPLTVQFTPNDKDYDPDISRKLNTPEVYSALLNRALRGAQRLIKNKRFTIADEVSEANRKYRVDNSLALEWLEDEILALDDICFVPLTELYSKFRSWCQEAGITRAPIRKTFINDILMAYPQLEYKPSHIPGTASTKARVFRLKDSEINETFSDENGTKI